MKTRIFVSESFNPWLNIAVEEWIFTHMAPDCQTLFLWRNDSTVVIGRNQNPWSECHLTKMEQDGVRLARRSTGGGAVFHDLGNTCFTFLSPKEGYDRSLNSKIILRALKRFGVEATASGRNDLVISKEGDTFKVSGAAYRETRDRAFHHGTLLLNADLNRLANYLTPHPKKLESKGRASVRARVMNLSELNPRLSHDSICPVVIDEFFKEYGERCEIEFLSESHLADLDGLDDIFARFSSWDWRFGHAPRFQQTVSEYLSWGLIEIHFDSDKGRIEAARVFSDALQPQLILSFERHLQHKSFTQNGIQEAIEETAQEHPECSSELIELKAWLFQQVETAAR